MEVNLFVSFSLQDKYVELKNLILMNKINLQNFHSSIFFQEHKPWLFYARFQYQRYYYAIVG